MNVEAIISIIMMTNWVNEAQIKPICEDPANCTDPHEIVLQQREQIFQETFLDFVFEGKPIKLTLKREMIESDTVRKRYVNSSNKVLGDPFLKNRSKPLTIVEPDPEPEPGPEPERETDTGPEPEPTPEP